MRASFEGTEHTIAPPRRADARADARLDARADAERAPLRMHAPRPARELVSVDCQPWDLPDPSSLLPLPSSLGARVSLETGLASLSPPGLTPALQGAHAPWPGGEAAPLDAPRARPVRAAVDYDVDKRGPVRAFSPVGGLNFHPAHMLPPEPEPEHMQREAFSPVKRGGGIESPLEPGHTTVFIGDSAEDMLRRAAAAPGGPLDNAEWFTRHSGVGGSPSARGGSPSRARLEEHGPYGLQASVFAPHSAFAQSAASQQLRSSKSSGDIAYKLALGTSPLLAGAGRSPNPMLESAGLARPPVAYGKRAKLPKLEWQPPAPQTGSIDPLSVVEWSTASASPSKAEFALGPPVLRPSEPEASWLAQALNVSLSPSKGRDLAQPVNFS